MLTYDEISTRSLAAITREAAILAEARAFRAPAPPVDLARIVLDLARGGLSARDRDALEAAAGEADFDPLRPSIPFSFCRALTAQSAPSAGFLVGTQTSEAEQLLRPWSVVTRAGVQIETGLIGNQMIPRVTARPTTEWQPTEVAEVTPSHPSVGQIALTPHSVGCVVPFSRQLALQANASRFVARAILREIGVAIDRAVISGAGASGEPQGIIGTAGVQTESGATLGAGVFVMKEKAAQADVDDERIAFIATPGVRRLLESRERAPGSGRFVWDRDMVADRRAFVSTSVPEATMICGDFGNVYVGIWGDAFRLEINPHDQQLFRRGGIVARVLVSLDVGVLHPAAFITAGGIT
jgi:HK97 family phage major capsid protein